MLDVTVHDLHFADVCWPDCSGPCHLGVSIRVKDRIVELARDWNAPEGNRAVLMILNKSVLMSMSASALIRSYVSIDPHVYDVVVGVHDCIPHLVDAAFVPFSQRRTLVSTGA